MSRIRTIKPEFFLDEEIAGLQPLTRILFVGLWTQADRSGRLEDRPARIKAQALPYDSVDLEALLTELETGGFIQRYDAEGRSLIQIRTFDKHQRPHPREEGSKFPSPPKNGHARKPRSPCIKTKVGVDENQGRGEGKGMEGNGEGEGKEIQPAAGPQSLTVKSWTAEACDDWSAATGGVAPGGRIGKALRPLVTKVAKEHALSFEQGWRLVRPWWQRYLADKDPEFRKPEDFAANPRQVVAAPGNTPKAHQREAAMVAMAKGGLRGT